MTDILLTTVELIDGVEVEGSAVTIATTDGVAGDPVGTAAAAVAAHVADTTDAHAIAGITGLQAALDAKAATTVTDDHETRIDALEVGGGGGAVDSVNGQTGVVVLDAADVGADAAGTAAAAVAALGDLATQVELNAHAADTTSVHGIVDTSALIVEGDSRLTDSRTPTAHAASHASAGSDPVTLAQSQVTGLAAALDGKADDGHTHVLANVTDAGTVAAVDLSGNASEYLAGDGTWATPAGGGSTINDRRWVAASPHAQDDEFRDGSLNAAWVSVDASGGASRVTWTEAGDSLSAKLNGTDAAGEMHAKVRPYALAVGEAIQCHISAIGEALAFPMGGLVIADGATHGSGNQVVARMCATGNAQPLYASSPWSGYNNRTATGTESQVQTLRWEAHFRLMRDASNVWRFYYSHDGISWNAHSTVTSAFTPSHVGLWVTSWGAGTGFLFSFDYFRVVTV